MLVYGALWGLGFLAAAKALVNRRRLSQSSIADGDTQNRWVSRSYYTWMFCLLLVPLFRLLLTLFGNEMGVRVAVYELPPAVSDEVVWERVRAAERSGEEIAGITFPFSDEQRKKLPNAGITRSESPGKDLLYVLNKVCSPLMWWPSVVLLAFSVVYMLYASTARPMKLTIGSLVGAFSIWLFGCTSFLFPALFSLQPESFSETISLALRY